MTGRAMTAGSTWFHEEKTIPVLGWRVDPIGLFWFGIVIVLLVLCGAQAFATAPALLLTWNGALTIALMLGFAVWYPSILVLRRMWRALPCGMLPGPRWLYPRYAVGLVLTVGLIALHVEFAPLIFADIGFIVMTSGLAWRTSVLPLIVVLMIYLAEGGVLHSGVVGLGYSLFAFALTSGYCYTMLAFIRQRAERERLITDLKLAQKQLQTSAERDVEMAALRERNRLAREMHDTLGHALVLIAVKIEAAQRLQAVDAARSTAELEDTKALVRTTMADLRSSLAGLRMSALEDQPFRAALTEVAAELGRRTGIEIAVTIAPEADALDCPIQEALYRVAQEALANVAKHARARHAWVVLALRDDAIQLDVSDDGIGQGTVPVLAHSGGHYGVTGMRERAEALGGALTIEPRIGGDGGGTLVRAKVPLREAAHVA